MAIAHIYRIVRCKSCKAEMVVEYLGPAVSVRIAGTLSSPGQVRCPQCNESHNYIDGDIEFSVKDNAPFRIRAS